MKRQQIISGIIAITSIFSLTQAHAYSPTSGDLATISTLETQINSISSGNIADTWNFSEQIHKILPLIPGQEERITYILKTVETDLLTQVQTAKIQAKISTKNDKLAFFSGYILTGILPLNDSDTCTGRYNTLDTLSFVNNIPTPLAIAARYRETHCGYYLPANKNGPFQIISKDYGTGAINEEIFRQSIQDFMDFAKTKIKTYSSRQGRKLTYTGYDLTGITSFAALYNGGYVSGNQVLPYSPKYVYEATPYYTGSSLRYGFLPKFFQTLNRELNSTY